MRVRNPITDTILLHSITPAGADVKHSQAEFQFKSSRKSLGQFSLNGFGKFTPLSTLVVRGER